MAHRHHDAPLPSLPALPSNVERLVRTIVHDYAALQAELQAWRWWLLVAGLIHLLADGRLNAPWGLVLVVVGAASFAVREAVVLAVYGTLLLCSAAVMLSNIHVGWTLFAVLQASCALYVLYAYTRRRTAEERYMMLTRQLDIGLPAPTTYATTTLPWVGVGLGTLALGLSGLAQWSLTNGARRIVPLLLPLNLAIVGLAVCLAVLVALRPRRTAVVGVVLSSLAVAGWIVMFAQWG